eukprot:Partr_v1_DN28006_c3_g2_i2_m57171 putative serine threonine protein kinase
MALHKLLGEPVAVKIVDKIHAPVVVREIETWRRLRHPHIAQLFEVLTSETKIYMVMEYVSGGEIFHYIVKNGPLARDMARRLFTQLLDAMKYCHDKRFVHRDLKLENILLDRNLNIKLIDFGFTREYDKTSKLLETYCGSTAYAAPEMIAGKKYSGPEADIWSLGVILYTMVCGYLPFDDDNEAVVHSKILSLSYEFPAFADDDIKDLIGLILKINPKERLSISQMLEHNWFKESPPSRPSTPVDSAEDGDQQAFKLKIQVPSPQQTPAKLPAPDLPSNFDAKIREHMLSLSTEEKLVLYHLAQLGFDVAAMVNSIRNYSCDQASALYFLLLTKMQNNPQLSTAALISTLSTPAFGFDQSSILSASSFESTSSPASASPSPFEAFQVRAATGPSSFNTGSIPSAMQQSINDRMLAMFKIASPASSPLSASFNPLSMALESSNPHSEDFNEGISSNSIAQYYGYLAGLARKSSFMAMETTSASVSLEEIKPSTQQPQSTPSKSLFNSPKMTSLTLSVPGGGATGNGLLSPSGVDDAPSRRGSAPEADNPAKSFNPSRRRTLARMQTKNTATREEEPLADLREFRERRNSKRANMISEEEEELEAEHSGVKPVAVKPMLADIKKKQDSFWVTSSQELVVESDAVISSTESLDNKA